MPRVHVTRNLWRFFPALAEGPFDIHAASAKEMVAALDARFPGLAGYLVDDAGALRQHVNLFIDDEAVLDRKTLGDTLSAGSTVHVMQALSGG